MANRVFIQKNKIMLLTQTLAGHGWMIPFSPITFSKNGMTNSKRKADNGACVWVDTSFLTVWALLLKIPKMLFK